MVAVATPIGADLLVIIGLAALIIPGLIAITLFAVTGPVIEIERRPVVSALRRSADLARQQFWTMALLGTLPLLLTYVLESQVPHSDRPGAVLPFIAVRIIGEAVVQAATGLLLVELCYRLRAAGPSARPQRPADRCLNCSSERARTGHERRVTSPVGDLAMNPVVARSLTRRGSVKGGAMPNLSPVTFLDARYSEENAQEIPWPDAVAQLERAGLFWVSSVRADGRPHVTPVVRSGWTARCISAAGQVSRSRRTWRPTGTAR